jgi:hypothetical protein
MGTMVRITTNNTEGHYALVFLHFLPPLAPGAVQLDCKASQFGALGRIKSQPAQRGIPTDRTADCVHRQRASEEPCGVCIGLGRRLGGVIESRLGGGG